MLSQVKMDISHMKCPSFRQDLSFLSNMYQCKIKSNGLEFGSSETLYQYFKSLDPDVRNRVAKMSSYDSKKFFSKNKNLIRDDWNEVRDTIMRTVLLKKFSQNKDLLKKLLLLDPKYLIEVNYWHDTYWGICTCKKCNGSGFNMLGIYLNETREKLSCQN